MSLTFQSPPRISEAEFTRVLERFHSPVAVIAPECYRIITDAGLDPAVALAFLGKESTFLTRGRSVQWNSWGNMRHPSDPSLANPPVPGLDFATYPSIQNSLKDWTRHIQKRYIARGLNDVDAAIAVYAPAFENDVEQYRTFVRDHVAQWIAEDQQMGNGWMPGVAHVDPKDMPDGNYTEGRLGGVVEAVVEHIAEGSYAGTIGWFKNPKSGVSAHFVISKKGEITQCVNLHDTAYTNGLKWNGVRWFDPEGSAVKPPWKRLRPPLNPIYQTATIENEGKSGDVWTPAQTDANVRVLQYVASEAKLVYAIHDTLIGHNEISPINRAHCPGSGCHLDSLAAAANVPMPIPHPVVTFLKTTAAANLREGPGTTFPIVLVMVAGETAGYDGDTLGESINGNNVWCHRADSLGFVWSGLLEAA